MPSQDLPDALRLALQERLASELGPEHRARLAVTPSAEGRYDVTVVAFDYFGELGVMCGLLSAHGLDIEAGHVATVVSETAPSVPGRRVVDVFRVRPRDGRAPEAERLQGELLGLVDLLAEGRATEARERIHLRLVEALERDSLPREASAVAIRFDNASDPAWTVLEVEGQDVPGFLYALANALAMRGIYVHEVRIEGGSGQARDRFRIARGDGGKIEDALEQESLRRAVSLIKQFTDLLPAAPDPARALRYFDQLLDRTAGLPDLLRGFGTAFGLRDLARFLGSSAFLWEDVLRPRLDRLLPLLAEWRTHPLRDRAAHEGALRELFEGASALERPTLLRDFAEAETLRIEARRVLDPSFGLEAFSAALSDLAEALVAGAARAALLSPTAAEGPPRDGITGDVPVALFGLGKLGGREIGYASDLELLLVYGTDRGEAGGRAGRRVDAVARDLVTWLGAPGQGLFRVDLRLRPHGTKGPLASPLHALRRYYRPGGGAAPFERQALVKLRFIAGDPELGREVERLRDDFVWSAEPWDKGGARRLRERQVQELVPPGRFNVKLSRGGLVDAEYAVQYLQIEHGRSRPEVRTPTTLVALDRLREASLLDPREHADLRAGYLFWRQVADALRMVRGQSDDLLLPDEALDEYGFLARRLGYPGARRSAAAALAAEARGHRDRLQALYDRRFRLEEA